MTHYIVFSYNLPLYSYDVYDAHYLTSVAVHS